MQITKHGKIEKQKSYHIFNCGKCGCVFQCEEDEYWEKPQVQYNSLTTISYSAYKTYMTSCPECHKIVEDNEYDMSSISCSNSTTKNPSVTLGNIENKTDFP